MRVYFLFLYCFGYISAASVELPSARILGGQNAAENQFPYQVSLQIFNQHFCGGSIISANYVVTAAHCVTSEQFKSLPVSTFSVRAGSTQYRSGGVLVSIARVIPHPQYEGDLNDIALLELVTPLTFSESIKPIPLARTDPPVGASVIISGWGNLRFKGPQPQHLQYLTLRTISERQCQREIGDVPSSVICLAHAPGKGACNGDSGGPAAYNGELIGVADFVIIKCGTRFPDGYAKISAFRNWLIENSDLN